MARHLRIEYAGALYHVLNRGNYRRDIFETAGAAQAFVTTLEEASDRFGWRVCAYAVMRNHFHLALETPQPNLAVGMHWLQATLATRFNRFRSERGHLFQGRYQAILVEDFAALARVVSYIHLNPARAGIVEASQVAAFRWSSLARFAGGNRFPGLRAESWLSALGFADDRDGWKSYIAYLSELSSSPGEQERQGWDGLSRGWALGTSAWRKSLARERTHLTLAPGIDVEQALEIKQARWASKLAALLAEANHTPEEAARTPKSAGWKTDLAARMRQVDGASVAWLAENLHMGKPSAVRTYLCRRSRANLNQQKAT